MGWLWGGQLAALVLADPCGCAGRMFQQLGRGLLTIGSASRRHVRDWRKRKRAEGLKHPKILDRDEMDDFEGAVRMLCADDWTRRLISALHM